MASGDRHQGIILLTSAVETCTSSLTAIHDHSKTPATVVFPSDHAVLHKDFLSLLTLIYGSTTKLSLTLRPSSKAYKAALTPLKDISDQISAISHCVRLFAPDHGIALMREVTSTAEDVIESVKTLLETFLASETHNAESSGNEYLVRTGAVHDRITKARGVSADNLASVRKKWKEDHVAMVDGLHELDEMIKNAQNSGNEDLDDDGWGELGLQSSQKMDQTELERAKKVYTVLRLSNLLHKQVVKSIFSPSTDSLGHSSTHASPEWDPFLSHSSALLTSADDLICTIYTPQNPLDVAAELDSYVEVVRHLHLHLQVHLQGDKIAQQLSNLNLDKQPAPLKDPLQWYNTCFDQIQKAADALKSQIVSS